MVQLLRRKPRRGTVWSGPSAFVDANEAAMLSIVPGHYALDAAGRPLFRLVAVDDAPGDADDGAWHLEVAAKGDPIVKAGRPVSFEAVATGRSGVQA